MASASSWVPSIPHLARHLDKTHTNWACAAAQRNKFALSGAHKRLISGSKCWTIECTTFRRPSSRILVASDDFPSCCDVSTPTSDSVPCSPPGFSPTATAFTDGATARVVLVVPDSTDSPFQDTTWEGVLRQTARRLNWVDEGFQSLVFTDSNLVREGGCETEGQQALFAEAMAQADLLFGVAITDPKTAQFLQPFTAAARTSVFFDSSPELEAQSKVDGVRMGDFGLPGKIAVQLGLWPRGKELQKDFALALDCWRRRHADDVWFSLLLLIHSSLPSLDIPLLNNLRAQDLSSLACMLTHCRQEIFECMADPQCKAAIDCLNSCGPTDQICSYRCIVSYESPLLESFSLCILQKHNCLGLTAPIRNRPEVVPLPKFRGQPLTHETAEELLLGRLGQLPWSWRVVAGQNAAYDQFPCQYQIFYRGKARGAVWYDPVFTVRTLEGQNVWRRRHYRVRRRKLPGTFTFSVLDNGVISEEFWTVVDVTDDLSWGLFYYSGAARAAGQSYIGAVLVSVDGEWPAENQRPRLLAALERCGIQEWELYRVDNSSCDGAPLGLPDDSLTPSMALLNK